MIKSSRAEKVINEARKETIIECAERAKIIYDPKTDDDSLYALKIIDKQSILSLINELK